MIRIWTSIGFLAQVLLGNVCLMPVAFAGTTTATPETHMEMVMTPVSLMSPLHCDQCITVTPSMGNLFAGKASCGGQCLSQTIPVIAGASFFRTSPPVLPALSLRLLPPVLHDAIAAVSQATAPPLAYIVDTTVLRL